ncbi:zinc dependent phospholipase C family protein [Paenibacillus sp. D51F]
MATWMTHFRIADQMLKNGFKASLPEFVVGHIGPDCGLPDPDTGQFQPPKSATHFLDADKMIRPELFLEAYLPEGAEKADAMNPRTAFLLGCYCHLLTDIEWIELQKRKRREPAMQALEGMPDRSFRLKSDWYGADFLYLEKEPANIFTRCFSSVRDFPDYLDIFPAGQIQKQIDRIAAYYTGHAFQKDWGGDYEFRFLSPQETDAFVHEVAGKLPGMKSAMERG